MTACSAGTGIVLFRRFADAETCASIVSNAEQGTTWRPAKVGHYENGSLISAAQDATATTAEVAERFQLPPLILARLQSDVVQVAKKEFGLGIAEFSKVGLSRYRPGTFVGRHRDTNALSTHRLLTTILYLNQAFEGGELVFPDLGVELKPRTGDMIVFLSEHFHLVRQIRKGYRYCAILFGENSPLPQ